MRRYLSVLLLILTIVQLTFAYSLYNPDSLSPIARREMQPEWEDIGWGVWRKRSTPFTNRFLRSLEMVKKNPDWHDLGWTWGRRK